MKLLVNGKTMEAREHINLRDLIGSCNVKPGGIIVVVSETVVAEDIWTDRVLTDGDRIELLSLVAGG
ncbi:MAG: Sulfur carrier protein ThiS [Syntrophorhabdus sp. PtaU1.Bin050]|jgi:thiamine biosynthesis protein ThiS|nr:MAG: Sulfur carrier protein ThiS [Syntrophorhabdus sp. PtaU1.Bin050]